MTGKHLQDALWATIQASVPVFCVDVVPLRAGDDDHAGLEIGLVLRSTPDRGERWCVIGGRLLLDESIADAAARELREATGTSLIASTRPALAPLLVEYTRTPTADGVYDLRQHSVSATIPVWMSGEGVACGSEAREFRWWSITALTREVMGFGQETLLPRIAAAAAAAGPTSRRDEPAVW